MRCGLSGRVHELQTQTQTAPQSPSALSFLNQPAACLSHSRGEAPIMVVKARVNVDGLV